MNKEEFRENIEASVEKGKPLCFHHRAVSGLESSNSLGNISSVLQNKNVDGLEFDIQLTSDGKIVVRHDFAIRTEQGYEWIKEITYEDLRKTVSMSDCPTLEELSNLLTTTDKIIDVEIKQRGIVNQTIKILKDRGIYERVIFTTLYDDIYKEILDNDHNVAWMYGYPRDRGKNLTSRWWFQPIVIPAVFLIRKALPWKIDAMMKNIPTDFFSFYNKVLSRELIRSIHAKSKYAIGATVSLNSDTGPNESIVHMTQMLKYGIDLIITDYPDLYELSLEKAFASNGRLTN